MTDRGHRAAPSCWFYRIALVLLGIPVGFQLLLGVGEVATWDLGGLAHLLLAAPLIVLGLLARRAPVPTATTLIVLGSVVALGFVALVAGRELPLPTIALVEVILLLPVVAGILLLLDATTPWARSGR